jgi:hypothetical protein
MISPVQRPNVLCSSQTSNWCYTNDSPCEQKPNVLFYHKLLELVLRQFFFL